MTKIFGQVTRRVPTAGMSHEEWETMRRSLRTIGGSDAASILGLNEYKSPYALWAEKTGKLTPEDISDKETVRLGNDLEQYVAERWCEKSGKRVQRCNFVLFNDVYPFAHANPDRVVVGENAGLECKTTSSWDIAQQLRSGKIPDHWYCQMVHYMMVTGADRWYLGALVFGTGFFEFAVERSSDEIAALAHAESVFYDGVCSDTPPSLDGSQATTDALRAIHIESAPGKSIDLTAVGYHVDSYNALGRQIKDLESAQKEHENFIKDFMQDAERGSYGNTSISWKTSSAKRFDKAAFEAANGKIPEQYYRTTDSRSFRVTVKKG